MNILDKDGFPVRNDNLTNFAYVGPNDGKQQAPEVYSAYRPENPADPTPIQPGETTQLKNTQTGKFCRLAQLPSAYSLIRRIGSSGKKPKASPKARSKSKAKASANFTGQVAQNGRHLLQTPSSCATQGVICDQDTIATATILTYTGSGLSYNGVPLVQSPVSKTLVLSSDPACTVPGGDKLTFPDAVLREWPDEGIALQGSCTVGEYA